MLFLVTWEFTDESNTGQQETLATFARWEPGPAQFLGFYGFAEGSGGCAIVEAGDAATLARTMAPFTPWIRFEARAMLPVQESAQIAGEALAWRTGQA